MDNSNTLAQWEKRVIVFKYIYSQLMKEEPVAVAKQNFFETLGATDADWMKVLEYFLEHKTTIINTLAQNLASSWTFDRLNVVDQAILIEAYSEYQVLKNDKSIVIDQAVITSKKYSDSNSYEYINAILDKVL